MTGAKPSAHLLVVDDVEMNRDMLSRRLRSRGFTVSLAENGYAALDEIAKGGLDAVLLDVMMPGLTGIDVLREVRKSASASELPIIMATARDQSEDIVEALKLGANDYVTKPLDFPVVLARLETHLALKRSQEEIKLLAQQLEVRNRFIRKTFGRYLSDEVVEQILETPEGLSLGGERKRITILMADLRGFTAMSEGTPPETVVHILNRYLGIMACVISEHRGTIDEFIGDAILALFGAPVSGEDDELRASLCAIRMQLAMAEVNRLNEEEGLPRLQMGIALNTGEVVVGNIGSETRSKYGVVGSHVNLTGRIESLTVGGQILMSQATRAALGSTAEVGWSQEIAAKGFRDPVAVHELIGLREPFHLRLPGVVEALERLVRPLPVSFTVLHEKHGSALQQTGEIVALSGEAAEIEAATVPPPFTDMRLRLSGPEGAAADAYGKVLPGSEAASGSFRLRFTSLPAGMAATFRSLLREAGR